MNALCLLLLVLTSGVTSLSLHELDKEWNLFKEKFNRTFKSGREEYYRYGVFTDNLKKIHHHNMKADMGRYSYWLGINQFADMTDKEFDERFLRLRIKHKSERTGVSDRVSKKKKLTVLKNFDWRKTQCVTPVKNQGLCGSCYAFAATGALESQHCIKTGKLVSLSEQNIIDCTNNSDYQNLGCGGGQTDFAFQYIIDEGGIDTEKSYPYTGEVGRCNFKADEVGATEKDYKNLPFGNEAALMAVSDVGPIAVCIDSRGTKLYKEGVYDGRYEGSDGKMHTCSRLGVTHAMLLVGYGESSREPDFWILKNSWGDGWGLDGYMKLIRKYQNTCGIATLANYPVV